MNTCSVCQFTSTVLDAGCPAASQLLTGNPLVETTEEEQLKMLMRNMTKMLRMVMGVVHASDNDSSNEDGYRYDVLKLIDTF